MAGRVGSDPNKGSVDKSNIIGCPHAICGWNACYFAVAVLGIPKWGGKEGARIIFAPLGFASLFRYFLVAGAHDRGGEGGRCNSKIFLSPWPIYLCPQNTSCSHQEVWGGKKVGGGKIIVEFFNSLSLRTFYIKSTLFCD